MVVAFLLAQPPFVQRLFVGVGKRQQGVFHTPPFHTCRRWRWVYTSLTAR